MRLGILEFQVARDPHAGPRGLIISHGGRCLQPETQPARSAAKVPRSPPEPPIAGSQPRAQSPPTGNIPGPPLPGSLPPSLLPPQPGLVRPQLPAGCWGTVRIPGVPRSLGARCWRRLGPRGGQPWAGAAGGHCGFRERLSNSNPLRRATWAAPRAWRVASRRGGHGLVSVPRFAPFPLPVLVWLSGGVLRGPLASPLRDEELAQGCFVRTQRRLERGKVVRGVIFLSPPRKPKQHRLCRV